MKFAVFVLVASFCLVSASLVPVPPQPKGDKHIIYKTSKLVLQTVKGVRCSITGVQNIRDAAQAYIDALEQCGQHASAQAHAIVDMCRNLITACDDVIHYKTELCYREVNGQEKKDTPIQCFTDLMRGLTKIGVTAEITIDMIKNVPEIYTDATSCIGVACRNLEASFTGYPSFVKKCAKLRIPYMY